MGELRGMPVVKAMEKEFKEQVSILKEKGIEPLLAVVRVGNREDDVAYENGIKKRFGNVDAKVNVIELPLDIKQEEFDNVIISLNNDEKVHGILVFCPLPKTLSMDRLKAVISPLKDVDCICMENVAKVFTGEKDAFAPCTPSAVMEILEHNNIELAGKKVVVVGRSMVVGKPLAMLLLSKNATVTICHTKTVNIEKECQDADIIVACAGAAKMIKKTHVRRGQVVIDVGINFLDGKMCGDVDYDEVSEIVDYITPVPGGVGTVTTSVLLKHVIFNAMN